MLDQEQIAEIAARHGFEPTDSVVTENAAEANRLHGQPCPSFNGDRRLYWHCDAQGRYDAENMLDGHLREEARVAGADCDSIGRFHEDAYGDD